MSTRLTSRPFVKPGFTLAEVMITLTTMGVLAALLIPMLQGTETTDTKLLAPVKSTISDLVNAYKSLNEDGDVDGNTVPRQIIERMNYVRRIEDASMGTTLITGWSGDERMDAQSRTETLCDPTFPCYLMQNGALLQYSEQTRLGETTRNINGLRFIIDPDGSGRRPGMQFVVFVGGRVTSWPMYVRQQNMRYGGVYDPTQSTIPGSTVNWPARCTAAAASCPMLPLYAFDDIIPPGGDPGDASTGDGLPNASWDPRYASSWTNG